MARLKFLIFSLVVLGLWAAHLYMLSPALSARAVDQTQQRAATVPSALKAKLAERRMEVQRVALKAATHPLALAALRAAKADAAADAVTQLRGAVSDAVPEALRASFVYAVAHEQGGLVARGNSAPAAEPSLDVAALAKAGADGIVRDAFGETFVFFSVPAGTATAIVGAPLVNDAVLDEVARQAGADGLGLIQDGKVVRAGGAQKKAVADRGAKATANAASAFEGGAVSSFGPFDLPFLTASSLGDGAPVRVAWREALPGTPYEVVAVVSAAPFMEALADYQSTALLIFLALVALTAAFAVFMRDGAPAQAEEGEALSPAELAHTQKHEETTAERIAAAQEKTPPPAPAFDAAPAQSDAGPEAVFPLGTPPAPEPQADQSAPEFGNALFAEAIRKAPAAVAQDEAPSRTEPPVNSFSQFDNQATMAYPAAADPFELASRQDAGYDAGPQGDFNPEATRVAAIPDELLRASARAETTNSGVGVASPRSTATYSPPPVAASGGVMSEEGHFQEVFREFLRTREQCGEPQDGLTFEKFAQKLRKNKDQLVAKYSCKTVRFQVYVKEGKAALKATPIKE